MSETKVNELASLLQKARDDQMEMASFHQSEQRREREVTFKHLTPGFSKWGRRPQMGSQSVSDGVATWIDWGRTGRAVKMQLKQNL